MIRRLAILSLAVGLILTAGARRAPAYWYDGPSWPSNPVMSLQFGSISNGVTLTDGSTTWGQPAEAAMAIWNQYMDRVQFRVIRDSTASTGLGNGVNNAFWSSSIYGRSWESYAGYALWLSSGSSITEADVLMNNQLSWNSYRGNAQSGVVDFRRLVMHEFGHVIGLNHPNDHGQNVAAVMNSSPGNTDTLTADDISAAQFLYSVGGSGSVSFPARNESLDFRTQLETKYRDGLKRGNSTTYVDSEGDIVWLSEYFRYRVNACSCQPVRWRSRRAMSRWSSASPSRRNTGTTSGGAPASRPWTTKATWCGSRSTCAIASTAAATPSPSTRCSRRSTAAACSRCAGSVLRERDG